MSASASSTSTASTQSDVAFTDDSTAAAASSSSTTVSSTDGTAPPDVSVSDAEQPALPRIVTVPDTGVLMWVQPQADTPVPELLAKQWCGIWNASLATVYNRTAQLALESVRAAPASLRCAPCAALAVPCSTPGAPRLRGEYRAGVVSPRAIAQVAATGQQPYWINLAVNESVEAWQWGAPNTLANSTDFLAGYKGWCSAAPPPAALGDPSCSQLAFAPDACVAHASGTGWGWYPRTCEEEGSYMCMASPRGAQWLVCWRAVRSGLFAGGRCAVASLREGGAQWLLCGRAGGAPTFPRSLGRSSARESCSGASVR